jgi:hypothetical protein
MLWQCRETRRQPEKTNINLNIGRNRSTRLKQISNLPAMDNNDFRRGKTTSYKVFGEAIAILAGNALLTEAFVLLSPAENGNVDCCSSKIQRHYFQRQR